jgi:cytochrome c553
MAVMAKPLSDEDINQLAAWFASLRVNVVAPD